MKTTDLRNKRVLITGISGFVGSNLAKKLRSLGVIVYGISRSLVSDKRNLRANILDYSVISNFIKNSKIQICFHLAGESLVEKGQKDPYRTFKINTEGTLNILEIARKNALEKVIVASTAHVYGNNKLPYIEEFTPKPSRPYETSKACTDLIAQSYADSFNLPVLLPRFVNIYGPGDLNFQRLIPKTIKAVLSNTTPKMWGGKAIRDYLFIDDAINAYIRLAKIDMSLIGNNRIFNFGSDSKISVEDLIKKIIVLSGKKVTIEKIDEERASEIKSQYVSFGKATKLLGWEPKVTLTEGLKKTLEWYKNYFVR